MTTFAPIRYYVQTQAPAGNWTDYMGYSARDDAEALEQYKKTAEYLTGLNADTKVRLILRKDSVIS